MTDYRRMVWQYYANVIALMIEWLVIFLFMWPAISWTTKLFLLPVLLLARFVDKHTLIYRTIWL